MPSRRFDEVDERRQRIVEDVIWLTDDTGEAPEQVARQLGYASAESLATVLDRWDEPSLARRLRRPRLGVWAA